LAQLASRNMDDLYPFIKMAQTGQRDGLELKGNHTKQDIEVYVSVLDKVLKIRDVVLQVNAAYIASAAMEDAYRTEPPFKLQGSYRDMNKLVAKIEPVMNDAEVAGLLLSHYQNETQTLTNAAEANLLKYKELTRTLNDTEEERWTSIKETFQKNNKLKGFGNKNEMAQVLQQMMEFTSHIEGIKQILGKRLGE
ncbi:MAG: AAA family ATPase, partial [Flavobacterium johnsoniae]